GEILLAREQQRDVDRHAAIDRFLDRRNAGRRAGNLDEQVVAPRLAVQRGRRPDRGLGVIRKQRRNFQRDESVHAVAGVERRLEQVGGAGEVLQRQREEQVFAVLPVGKQVGDRAVVVVSAGDGLVEDRRVGRQPRHVVVGDVFRQ